MARRLHPQASEATSTLEGGGRRTDLDHVERRLLEERDQTLENLQQATEEESEGQRESAGELSRMPTHLADAASDTQETEKDLANVNRESHQLTLIDEALRRLREEPETYTTCERCSNRGRAARSGTVDAVVRLLRARDECGGIPGPTSAGRCCPLRPSGRTNNPAGQLSRSGDRARGVRGHPRKARNARPRTGKR